MKFQFTHPHYLLLLPVALGWIVWWFAKSDVYLARVRRWTTLVLRLLITLAAILALAGLQWLHPIEGLNVLFLLDRSESVPSLQQQAARRHVNLTAREKKDQDRVGVLVFGSHAALESTAQEHVALDAEKVLAVVGTDRTDLASAIRLGTAAFPETGQKRLVLVSDGNENLGDAMNALLAARPLGVTLDVIPVGTERGQDVSVPKLGLPSRVKKGSAFETKIFVESDRAQKAKVRFYRNNESLGEQEVSLSPGKNLFSFPQQLTEPGFYQYSAFVEAAGDVLPQNNQATGFLQVRGDPRILLLSARPGEDQALAAALRASQIEVILAGLDRLPKSLAELTSYDTVFLSNVPAGDLGQDSMRLIESAVRDFGVGLVCVGGDQAYAAGAYRGTPLEAALPVHMELDSKKVLPNGALVLVMHGMEFNDGNQIARDCALGVLDSLGPRDELGVVLWDGTERWLFPLAKVGDRKTMGQQIAGMNQGDLMSFQGVLAEAHKALQQSTANLKHIIVFSDGDPVPPAQSLMKAIVGDRITVSTVLIAGHSGPETMEWIADEGQGRFYNVTSAANLPQVFIKESAVILKSAIFEESFKPQLVAASEVVRGIGAAEYPALLGYVSTTPKDRAETPLLTEKGDPLLAHWQYGLGRAVAFTSDAKSRWARAWLGWDKFRQFWTQIAQWSLRRVESGQFNSEVTVDQGQGRAVVEALDEKGNYRNFLQLQATVVSPNGTRQIIRFEQTGPGRYEAPFETREVGAYLLNLMEFQDGQLVGTQVAGASVNFSPEYAEATPNMPLLRRLAETGKGRLLDPSNPADNPFLHDRVKTFQPRDLWSWLLQGAILAFVLDVGVRRIQIEREQWLKAAARVRNTVLFWRRKPVPVESEESLAALLARRNQIRQQFTTTTPSQTDVAQSSEPPPSLFQPRHAGGPVPEAFQATRAELTPAEPEPEETTEPPQAPAQAPASTASRLLEAKRRAQKRKS